MGSKRFNHPRGLCHTPALLAPCLFRKPFLHQSLSPQPLSLRRNLKMFGLKYLFTHFWPYTYAVIRKQWKLRPDSSTINKAPASRISTGSITMICWTFTIKGTAEKPFSQNSQLGSLKHFTSGNPSFHPLTHYSLAQAPECHKLT